MLAMADGAKFARRKMRSFVSSRPGDSLRAVAHESGCPIGYSDVALTIISASLPPGEICCVAAPAERETCNGLRAHLNAYRDYARALSSCQIAWRECRVSLWLSAGRKFDGFRGHFTLRSGKELQSEVLRPLHESARSAQSVSLEKPVRLTKSECEARYRKSAQSANPEKVIRLTKSKITRQVGTLGQA